MYYISFNNFEKFLGNLRDDYEIYAPIKKDGKRFYKKYADSVSDIVIGEVRPFEPLKSFFLHAREKVADGFKADTPHFEDRPFAIIGVKACDLKGFKILDYVFFSQSESDSGGKVNFSEDPFYIRMREKNLIISADCTCAIDTCFCLALGIKPHPQEDFDINLSQIKNGFIVETGSEKGSQLIEKNPSFFTKTTDDSIAEMKDQRTRVIKEVESCIEKSNVPNQETFKSIIEKNYESNIWEDEAKTCVECGACNTICPTCHCFLLYDQKSEEGMARLRIWDSCMIKDYALVAGGANPRAKLWMRLRNRFEKKFDFFPKLADVYACTGCGRCISACPAKIDIRKVLNKLVSDAKKR